VRTLEHDGWTVVQGDTQPGQPVHGVVYVPGLLEDTVGAHTDPATALLDLVESVRPQFPSANDGGARVVAVGSRDWLGWPSRPRVAAHAAGLVATVRSLTARGRTRARYPPVRAGAADRRAGDAGRHRRCGRVLPGSSQRLHHRPDPALLRWCQPSVEFICVTKELN
jgi:hypothetical protein